MTQLRLRLNIIITIVFSLISLQGYTSFYQAGTMAEYCEEYLAFISLNSATDQHQAGVCAGYIASALEIMDLSGQLCDKDQINLNSVATLYIEEVTNKSLHNQPASFVMIEFLQNNYSCKEE